MPHAPIFLSVFGAIFVAELPDKTAIAALVLATRLRAAPVFLGAALALAVQSAMAVAAGRVLSLLPARPVHVGAGVLFLLFAVLMWRKRHADEEQGPAADHAGSSFWRALATVFGVVFLAELGDLTQLATAVFAARYADPVTVFGAATLALWCVAALAVLVGNRAGRLLDHERTQKAASVVFAVLGVLLVAGVL